MSKKQEQERLIRAKDFGGLFTGIGWDLPSTKKTSVELQLPNGSKFLAKAVCQKLGFVVCVCESDEGLTLKRAEQKRLTQKIGRFFYENLLIIHGKNADGKNAQRWMACIRPKSGAVHTATVDWREEQGFGALWEKISELGFSITEEDGLAHADVVERVTKTFDKNRAEVTKQFYEQFRKELDKFANFIDGIDDLVDKKRYASLMLNRLMFIYFIQKKGFLNGNTSYLQDHLKRVQKERGKNQFHKTFYRVFLRKLFSQGLDTPPEKRKEEEKRELGNVPYLNGGLFDFHQLETDKDELDISDSAFERIFAFFDRYSWHLDTRPNASGNDINPDVLGYIFEKYINDRAAMGAYYTQEDITGYIAQNTILPFLLARAKEGCSNAFRKSGIWRFLREEPDSFIHEAVKHGTDRPDSEIPENIARGIPVDEPDLLTRRAGWNAPAPEEFALPTETWREVIARRRRCAALREKLKEGKIQSVDDIVSNNINIALFVRSALYEYEGADFIAAIFRALAGVKEIWCEHKSINEAPRRGVSVLDPSCGSGAFLFAALNTLKPVYDLCVERMRQFVEEDDRRLAKLGAKKASKRHMLFRVVLEEIGKHPNEEYWIYKTIILRNLYGVDLMEDAVEIAKLRLFLKLAAVAEYKEKEPNLGLEPLPDIDYNIRSGNSLIGYDRMSGFERWNEKTLARDTDLVRQVQADATGVEGASRGFLGAQDKGSGESAQEKSKLNYQLKKLNETLTRHLARAQYGEMDDEKYQKWKASYAPFHWLAEFYGIMRDKNGNEFPQKDGFDIVFSNQDGFDIVFGNQDGFDIVIGNPPYVGYNAKKLGYRVTDYKTERASDLYAFFMERSLQLANEKAMFGMIVPISITASDRCDTLREIVLQDKDVWVSSFADRPNSLFLGVHQMLSVVICRRGDENVRSTSFRHWLKEERVSVFDCMSYSDSFSSSDSYAKIGNLLDKEIIRKVTFRGKSMTKYFCAKTNNGSRLLSVCSGTGGYWLRAFTEPQESREFKNFYAKGDRADVIAGIICSSLFYFIWRKFSNCRHLRVSDIERFHCDLPERLPPDLVDAAKHAVQEIEKTREFRGGKLAYQQYRPAKAKRAIDLLDVKLAELYTLTPEELDYIINYDIKYRMGDEADAI